MCWSVTSHYTAPPPEFDAFKRLRASSWFQKTYFQIGELKTSWVAHAAHRCSSDYTTATNGWQLRLIDWLIDYWIRWCFSSSGRVIYRRIGGGVYRDHYLIDIKREYIPDNATIEEKVVLRHFFHKLTSIMTWLEERDRCGLEWRFSRSSIELSIFRHSRCWKFGMIHKGPAKSPSLVMKIISTGSSPQSTWKSDR